MPRADRRTFQGHERCTLCERGIEGHATYPDRHREEQAPPARGVWASDMGVGQKLVHRVPAWRGRLCYCGERMILCSLRKLVSWTALDARTRGHQWMQEAQKSRSRWRDVWVIISKESTTQNAQESLMGLGKSADADQSVKTYHRKTSDGFGCITMTWRPCGTTGGKMRQGVLGLARHCTPMC